MNEIREKYDKTNEFLSFLSEIGERVCECDSQFTKSEFSLKGRIYKRYYCSVCFSSFYKYKAFGLSLLVQNGHAGLTKSFMREISISLANLIRSQDPARPNYEIISSKLINLEVNGIYILNVDDLGIDWVRRHIEQLLTILIFKRVVLICEDMNNVLTKFRNFFNIIFRDEGMKDYVHLVRFNSRSQRFRHLPEIGVINFKELVE